MPPQLPDGPTITVPRPIRKPLVSLKMPKQRLFVGSYHRIPVTISPFANVSFDDLRFEIPAGPRGGLISPSRDKLFNPKRPHVMLIAGFQPGKYDLHVVDSKTSDVLETVKFAVDTLWADEEAGPSRCFTGIVDSYNAGSAWGGGPAGPQNLNVSPATGTRRIAILLVDTSSQRFSTDAADLQNHRDRWLDAVVDGVTSGGVTRSSSLYYHEASFNNLTLSAQVFGPVSLAGAFGDYFNADGSPKGGYYQACFTAADGVIDYDDFDTLLCVSQQVDGPPRQGAWPYASIGSWGPFTTGEGDRHYGVISMPNDWDAVDARELYETFSHELGHNLGLGRPVHSRRRGPQYRWMGHHGF